MASYLCGLWHCLQRQEVKKGILKSAKDFTRKLGVPAACYVIGTKHFIQGLWESERRPGQQYLPQLGINIFPNIPKTAQFVFFHHTTLQRWLEVELQQGISSGYWVVHEVSTRARSMMVLGWQSAESCKDVHKVIKTAGQSYSHSGQVNVFSLCWGVTTAASEVGEHFILCPSR